MMQGLQVDWRNARAHKKANGLNEELECKYPMYACKSTMQKRKKKGIEKKEV